MTAPPTAPYPLPRKPTASTAAMLIVPCLIGALVALALGIYGRVHSPTGIAINIAGFSSPGTVKSWLATGATAFAIVQVVSALVMYGKIPRVTAPDWIGGLHRWSGRIAFLLAVPVAIHCLYALGFQQYSTRVLLHSVFGCLFLPKRDLPGWVLPVAGAVVFTVLVVIWLTSAYWFFSTFGIKR
jgi:hypothetical protein